MGLQSQRMSAQVEATKAQMDQLRQQQEELERQREALETLRLRQDRLLSGRRQVMGRMEQDMAAMAGELESCHQRIELLVQAHEDYQFHLRSLRSIQPEAWQREEISLRLDESLENLEAAEECHEKTSQRLRAELPLAASRPSGEASGLSTWFLRGLCLHSPILSLALWYWWTR
jgi:hypothetical protein